MGAFTDSDAANTAATSRLPRHVHGQAIAL